MTTMYCTRRWIEARCHAAGMTMEQCAQCIVSGDGDAVSVDPDHPNYPRPGLGDIVASGLEAVGITKERVAKVTGKPCNCKSRQAALNRLGERLGLPPGSTDSTQNPR